MRLGPVLGALALAFACGAAAESKSAELGRAAAFYHRGQLDSALQRLESLRSQGPWKRRDSLSLLQYLGMASARKGRDSAATAYFSGLLALDSLFQFPSNEDSAVLADFARARNARDTRNLDVTHSSDGDGDGDSADAPAAEPASHGLSILDSARAARADAHIGIVYGAVPMGFGWLMRDRTKYGLTLGLLEAGGVVLSLYASEMQTRQKDARYGIQNGDDRASATRWQWVQRISLSTALGAYLFSLFASAGD